MAASVANTFFWKWDQHQQDKGDLWTGVAKTVQTAVQLAVLSAIPPIGLLSKFCKRLLSTRTKGGTGGTRRRSGHRYP